MTSPHISDPHSGGGRNLRSITIAEVHARAVEAVQVCSDAKRTLARGVYFGWLPTDDLWWLHDRIRLVLEYLGDAYDQVATWWVSPEAPEFDRNSASLLEGVLRTLSRLSVAIDFTFNHLSSPLLSCFTSDTRYHLALAATPELDERAIILGLRREARIMEIHSPAASLAGSVGFEEIMENAREEVGKRIPDAISEELSYELPWLNSVLVATRKVEGVNRGENNPDPDSASLVTVIPPEKEGQADAPALPEHGPLYAAEVKLRVNRGIAASANRTERPKKGKNVQGQMLSVLFKNREAIGWKSSRWASELQCGEATVRSTRVWKVNLPLLRQQEALQMAGRMGSPQIASSLI